MPFHPADLILGQFLFPTRRRLGADFGEGSPRRGIPAPRLDDFRWRENNFRLELNFKIIANTFHNVPWFAKQSFELNEQTRNLASSHASREFRSHAPVRDHVIN